MSLLTFDALGIVGCDRPAPQHSADATAGQGTVVVYTALDRQFSEPILHEFTRQTGIEVKPVYDTESTKTVGLVNRIRAEAGRPRCDVFWNNEILNTLRLKAEGLLQRCEPAQAEHYPARYRDKQGYWYGLAARARVIIVNTDLVSPADLPTSAFDLARPAWRGRVGMAKPLFGTTASHVACLFALLGEEKARRVLGSFKENDIQILAGNKTCAQAVAAGRLAFAWTDTDDAIIEREAGRPVHIVFPDSGADGMGTLLLPNTLALVKGAPHRQAGVKLIDYLLSPQVEAALARGPSAQIPLHRLTKAHSRLRRLDQIRQMPVDFNRAAEMFAPAAAYIQREFLE